MTKHSSDDPTIIALLDRFTQQRLPRALLLEKRVKAGETLNELDLEFLDQVFKDAQQIMPLTDRHPEYQELVTKAIQLYSDITQTALENQNNKKPSIN